jgi:hypothetical protein
MSENLLDRGQEKVGEVMLMADISHIFPISTVALCQALCYGNHASPALQRLR